ncbi:MAG: glycosyltransferase family 4 protein [Caldilineaceae bacterium]|nr:glycosyltransferase family 4 protein [Caldilineaceae bacterium]
MTPEPELRVCYFGTYRATYSRNRIMIKGLRRNGVTLIECNEPLWRGIEDRVAAVEGGWRRPAFWWRVARAYGRLLIRFLRLRGKYDVMVVGYPGQFDIFLARILTWLDRKPLVWDVFMSIYLIAWERKLDQSSPTAVALLQRWEQLACRLPEMLILDTEEYVAWFGKSHGASSERFRLVPTGVESDKFRAVRESAGEDDTFTVLYYGTFIPNHGVLTMVEAARVLANDPSIYFEMVGDGPELAAAQALANRYGLTNIRFVGWLEQQELTQRISTADLCLGAFGETPQSLMTVQNKIYECLAMGKPLVSGRGPAVERALRHAVDLFLCPRNDPVALAQSILLLRSQPQLRARLAEEGARHVEQAYSLTPIGARFRRHLLEVQAQSVEPSMPASRPQQENKCPPSHTKVPEEQVKTSCFFGCLRGWFVFWIRPRDRLHSICQLPWAGMRHGD